MFLDEELEQIHAQKDKNLMDRLRLMLEAFNFVRNYPVSQIIAPIEDGAEYITRDQLTAI